MFVVKLLNFGMNIGFYGFFNFWVLVKNCIFGNKCILFCLRCKCDFLIERVWILFIFDVVVRVIRNIVFYVRYFILYEFIGLNGELYNF